MAGGTSLIDPSKVFFFSSFDVEQATNIFRHCWMKSAFRLGNLQHLKLIRPKRAKILLHKGAEIVGGISLTDPSQKSKKGPAILSTFNSRQR